MNNKMHLLRPYGKQPLTMCGRRLVDASLDDPDSINLNCVSCKEAYEKDKLWYWQTRARAAEQRVMERLVLRWATKVADVAPSYSYHDVHVTTDDIARVSIFNLPYGLELTCSRVGGWDLWKKGGRGGGTLIASEYGDTPLTIDVSGYVIMENRPAEKKRLSARFEELRVMTKMSAATWSEMKRIEARLDELENLD